MPLLSNPSIRGSLSNFSAKDTAYSKPVHVIEVEPFSRSKMPVGVKLLCPQRPGFAFCCPEDSKARHRLWSDLFLHTVSPLSSSIHRGAHDSVTWL